jgi:PleD family two-component response regulator
MDETKTFMEKIQTEIAALVYTESDPEIRATVSIVLTQVTRDDTVESCMARVDEGMQQAKNTRRNDIWIV